MERFAIPDSWIVVLGLSILFLILLTIRRLFLHPLRHFPGPPLAALTIWYKAYYDVVKGGALLEHLRVLHGRYGTPSVSFQSSYV